MHFTWRGKFFSDMLSCSSTSWVRAEGNKRRRPLRSPTATIPPSPDLNFFWWLVLSLKLSPLIRASSAWLCKSGSLLKLLLIMELMMLWSNKSWVSVRLKILFHYESVAGSLERLDVCHYSNYFLYCAFTLSSLLSTFL